MREQKKIKILNSKAEGWAVAIFPFNEELKEGIKEAMPRDCWHYKDGKWAFKAEYLEVVRKLAQATGWLVSDSTLNSKDEIEATKANAHAEIIERHVAAFLAVLPHTPHNCFKAVAVSPEKGIIELELAYFLDDADLFSALANASLDAFRQGILGSWEKKRSWGFKLEVAYDSRIITALLEKRVRFFKQYDLSIVGRHENGTAQLIDDKGNLFIGSSQGVFDANESWHDWSWAIIGEEIWSVVPLDEYLGEWLSAPSHRVVGFGGAWGLIAKEPSKIMPIIRRFGLESWLNEWVANILSSKELKLKMWAENAWTALAYEHKADDFLAHLWDYGNKANDLLEFLGWDKESLAWHMAQVEDVKRAAATTRIEADRVKAKELARPKIEKMGKDDLFKLAERFGLVVKKSATKAALVELLGNNQAVAESLIGLNKFIKDSQ